MRILIIVAIAAAIALESCSIMYPVFIRNYTNDTVALVIEPRSAEYFDFLTTQWRQKLRVNDSLSTVSIYQEDTLLEDRDLTRAKIEKEIGYLGDSSLVVIVLPPRSTTKCFSFNLQYVKHYVSAYIQMQDNTKRYLGSADMPLIQTHERGGRLTRPNDAVVYDIR